MSQFSKTTAFGIDVIVASGAEPIIINAAVKTGVAEIANGQVVILKATGAEPWDGTAAGKLGITTAPLKAEQKSLPVLVFGCYLAGKVTVNKVAITVAQQITLMNSHLYAGDNW
ncbi:hypothetical protein [Shewanella halifaxensis]|uniref:hypothetical protein n=1 Tax=Shewanella halifaxensis TaxID=271098 RepID=UPI000D59EA1C|nr:hypothetical protein [Shewanella halifaxensis]